MTKTDELLKDYMSWNTVKEKYLEFHKMDAFTEKMAIDIDFGYWLVNQAIGERMPTKKEVIAKGEKEITEWLKGNTRKEKQHYRVAFRRSFEFVLRHMKGGKQ